MTERQKRIRVLREEIERTERILRSRSSELAMLEQAAASATSEGDDT